MSVGGMSIGGMIDEAVALYGVDPGEFVAARKQLVRELKAAKRADDAAAVAKLPKPRLGEHTLNRVARDQPEVTAAFARAVGAATKAQSAAIGGAGGEALRASSAELRTATNALVDAAEQQLRRDGRDSPTQRDEVLSVIRSLTNEDGVAQLVAGVVGSGVAPTGGELFAGAPDPPDRPSRPKPKAPSRSQKRTAAPAESASPPPKPTKAELAAERRRQKEIADARQTVARAERDVRAAQRALESATERLVAAETARDEAQAALEALDPERDER